MWLLCVAKQGGVVDFVAKQGGVVDCVCYCMLYVTEQVVWLTCIAELADVVFCMW